MDEPRAIVVATDHSESAELATRVAASVAKRSGARLHLVHALEVPLPIFEPYAVTMPVEFVEDARKAARKRLDELRARLEGEGLSCTTDLGEVPAAPYVADQAKEVGADWIVVGTHGRTGLKRLALGSVAERTVQLAPCTVLTVKGTADAFAPRKIVVGLDFSDASRKSLAKGLALAKEYGAELVLVHALDFQIPLLMPDDGALPFDVVEASAEAARKELAAIADTETGDVPTETLVVRRPAAAALASIAEERSADLIVTGSRGLSGLSHALLGSVAEHTLRAAPCSVLTVKTGE